MCTQHTLRPCQGTISNLHYEYFLKHFQVIQLAVCYRVSLNDCYWVTWFTPFYRILESLESKYYYQLSRPIDLIQLIKIVLATDYGCPLDNSIIIFRCTIPTEILYAAYELLYPHFENDHISILKGIWHTILKFWSKGKISAYQIR